MVAYSFAPQFCALVASGLKTQTVRGMRKRHAQPGDRVQLYAGLRTKHCVKLVDADPICTACTPILIVITVLCPEFIESIKLGDRQLNHEEIEAFAQNDGFGADLLHTARWNMGDFWLDRHGSGQFHGFLIEWTAGAQHAG